MKRDYWSLFDNISILAALIAGLINLFAGEQVVGLLWVLVSGVWGVRHELEYGDMYE